MTQDKFRPCGLGAYLEAITHHGRVGADDFMNLSQDSTRRMSSASTPAASSTDDGNNQIPPMQQSDLPQLSFPADDRASPIVPRIERGASLPSPGLQPELGHDHLVPVGEIYEYCTDASECDYQSDIDVRDHLESTRRRTGGRDSDSSDGDDGAGDGFGAGPDDVYDSDLDPISSDVRHEHHKKKMTKWKSLVRGRFENMLLDCIVNTDGIAPNYQEIFIADATIKKLEQVTSLALLRPKAFSRGILKSNKITGAVLYGPPGTGKSLLARATAKQSNFNMISISTSEIWQKCHGEDEKMIKAVFSLARKMKPCVVFVDEADAMLGARKAGEKRHIRAMLNQFLMEWDGLTTGLDAPFVLLATNRPFDLDPAVLRRAPVHIPLNVPTKQERLGIIRLLLRDENQEKLKLETLAALTEGYTGSDLKNMCVSAATKCVSEQSSDKFDRRMEMRHFESAREMVKATNMGAVNTHEFQKFEGKLPGMNGRPRRDEDDD